MNKCKAPHCGRLATCKGLCPMHYYRFNKYNSYDLPDQCKLVEKSLYTELHIFDIKGKLSAKVMIDKEDSHKVRAYRWHLSKGYVIGPNKCRLHRYLMDCPDNMVVDHINRNRIDNRKSNLRICTPEENRRNVSKRKHNKSGYKGVSMHTKVDKYSAELTHKGVKYYLGLYHTKEEAALAYNNKLDELGDTFSPRNKITN